MMSDLSCLAESFEEICANLPEGYLLSERVIDPAIVIDTFNARIVARLAGTRSIKGLKLVYLALSNRHSWVLDGRTIRPLPKDAPSVFLQRLNGSDPGDLRYSDAIQLMRNISTVINAQASESFLKAGKVAVKELDGVLAVPGLTAELFPYQARGVRWMWDTIRYTGGLILADEMGLGKTLQIIALLLLEPPKNMSPALIVCPTSLIANWQREFSRFAPGMTLMVHRGSGRTGVFHGLQTASVVITTYDTMVNDIAIFSSFEWSWVICDEAQAIKNPESNRRGAIASIPRRRTIPMTGTPVENSLVDLWSLVDIAVPGVLGNRKEFEASYPDSIESAQAVGRLCDPIMLKRQVADVAGDLPDRINIDVPLELDNNLVDHYMQVRKATMARYPVAGALVATLQLQLLCAHPWLRTVSEADTDGESTDILPSSFYPLMTPKMERATALLREAFFTGKKVLVFAIFNRIGDLLIEALSGFHVYWGAINGSTPQNMRQTIIDEFSAYNGAGCLVLNPKAAGAGLNITAATVVIHFTPVWNPALEAQASARAHRRGQTQPVTIYRLYYRGTVEEVMIDRSTWKSELANESVPVSVRDRDDTKRALEIVPGKI